MDLLERLRDTAAAAGLSGLGVADAGPFGDVRAEMERRIGDGTSASLRFTYTDPSRATDVRVTFPWARRLVVTAWAYVPAAGNPGPAAAGTGRIARFAADDHYGGLRDALAFLAAVLVAAGHRAEVLADDSRLVDRAAAVRAGVGWWGKSAQVLTPGPGPWILLGSVVTDASLPVSEPMRRDCGSCDACLPACPTGALVAPGVLDARRCLAHWAQAPGVVPAEFRRAMGDRIYGCDVCLEACPPGRRILGAAPEGAGRVDVAEVLGTDDRTLRRRFTTWYVPRNQVRYIRRNALIVLGNTGGPDSVGVAAGYATHPDSLLRLHAVWALGELGGTAARAVLTAAAVKETDEQVRAEIQGTLARC